jgi:tripartite ATP-independent transporter DctP family solute receptor
MKKTGRILTAVLMIVLVLGPAVLFAGGEKEAPGKVEPKAEAKAEPAVRLRIGHANAPADNSALHVTAMIFKEMVEKNSGGRIQAQIFPSGQLGKDSEMADNTVSGAQDVLVTSLNLITNYAPRLNAVILPYMFEDNMKFRKAREALWKDMNDYLVKRSNMRLLVLWDSGYRHVMSTKPVRELADLQKLKFRVPPSPVMIKMVESWGIKPTPVEWSEVFNALQLGVVDAIEVDDSVLISARMNEVVKYITDNDHILQVSTAVMSELSYKKLPAPLQAAVDKAIADTKPLVDARSAGILDEARKVSTKVRFLGRPKDYGTWADKARTIWSGFYKIIGEGDEALGKATVDDIFAAAGK